MYGFHQVYLHNTRYAWMNSTLAVYLDMWGNSSDAQIRNESPTTPNHGTADDYEDDDDGDDYDDYNGNDDGCEFKKNIK